MAPRARVPSMSLFRLLLLAPLVIVPARADGPAAPVAGTVAADHAGPVSPAGLESARREALASALELAARDPLFASSDVSVQVVDVLSGEEVWHHGEDKGLVPASVMKVLTTEVALRELGPAYRVPTWIMADGPVGADGVLAGSLSVKGQGDPTMVVERMWRMALDLKLKGVTHVKKDLVFDAGYFEGGATPIPGWANADDLANPPSYFPMLSALSVNYNLAQIVVRPGAAAGQPATATTDVESPVVKLDNQVKTGSKASRAFIRVEREVDAKTQAVTFHLTGSVPQDGAAESFYRPVADPVGQYVACFTAMLRAQGIQVDGRARQGTTPPDARLVLRVDSEPLTTLVAQTSKSSNNFYAEQLLRILGAERRGLPGTTEKGVDVIAAHLVELGIPRSEFTLVNGSGLARGAMLRPSHVNAVLIEGASDPAIAPEFTSSLAVAGRDGTLWSRFREDAMDGRLRGKTGTLAGISSLAGYVRGADGRLYAFTFFTNGIPGAPGRARRAHDKFVAALAGQQAPVAANAELEP